MAQSFEMTFNSRESAFAAESRDAMAAAKEKVEANAEKAQERFMMSEYMLAAMQAFAQMDKYDIQGVARECAMNAVMGISPGTNDKYTISAFPGRKFSGYEYLAYYYVARAIADPDRLMDTGLPFHEAYAKAKEMWEKGR